MHQFVGDRFADARDELDDIMNDPNAGAMKTGYAKIIRHTLASDLSEIWVQGSTPQGIVTGAAATRIIGVAGMAVPRMATFLTEEVLERIGGITARYGNHYCDDCAEELIDFTIKNGIPAKKVTIRYSGPGFIMSKTHGAAESISETGYHAGVLIDDMVFDNIHKTGIPFDQWVDDFYGLGDKTIELLPNFPK